MNLPLSFGENNGRKCKLKKKIPKRPETITYSMFERFDQSFLKFGFHKVRQVVLISLEDHP